MSDLMKKRLLDVAVAACVAMAVIGASAGYTLAKHKHPEKVYQEEFCREMDGRMEVAFDGVRADCVTANYAIEVEFAPKWKDAVGQSLLYGLLLKKQPGIALIMEEESDDAKNYDRLIDVIKRYKLPIKIWALQPKGK